MSVAPRDQLNEDERRQLDNYLSRQARKKSQAMKGADDSRGPSSGYHTPLITHPHTSSAITPPDTRLSSSPDLDHDQSANTQQNHDGDISGAPRKASPAGQPRRFLGEGPLQGWGAEDRRDNLVALATASASKLHDSAGEQEHHISGSIDIVGAAEQSIGHNVTGHGGSRLRAAGPRQTLLVTPNAGARDQDQSTPWLGHHPFATPTSPLVIHAKREAHARDEERYQQLAIGPVSLEAQLHMLAIRSDGGEPAEELRKFDETAFQGGHVPVLVVDSGSVLFCTGIIAFLWVVWWLWSM